MVSDLKFARIKVNFQTTWPTVCQPAGRTFFCLPLDQNRVSEGKALFQGRVGFENCNTYKPKLKFVFTPSPPPPPIHHYDQALFRPVSHK